MSNESVYAPRVTPRHARLTVRGVDYFLSDWGDESSAPVIYLHGWGDTGSTFQFVVDAMAGGLRIVAPDWRGFGKSAHAGPAYWFPDYLADLDALLERYSPSAPAVLIGHSMGANVASLYAGALPERVAALINLEGFGLPDRQPADAPAHYRRWLERSRGTERFKDYASFDQLALRIRKRSPRLDAQRARFVAREWAEAGGDGVVRLRADPAHRLPNAVLYRRAEAEACWREIRAPVLLVSGAETELGGALGAWRDPDPSRRPIPGAASEVVAGAGHMLHFEAPARVAALIEDFVAAL